jgi:catalase
MPNTKKITADNGCPVNHYEDSATVGKRGPVLLEDYFLQEKLALFNRERIPERVVHAKGTGAYGKFTVTHDISKYTRAKLFSEIGKETKVFTRFSTVGGEMGSADTERDPRGFAVKFYTEEGNWDIVGNNTPVFFIKDPKKFPDFVHTQKRNPKTNLKDATAVWDYWSLHPESIHQVLILMSDRGIPDGYRFMNGYGSHTFSLLNELGELMYVKFHYKSMQGTKTLSNEEATRLKGEDPDYAQRDLMRAISKGDFPKYALKIQVMTETEAQNFQWNPFDLTKVWSHKEYPLLDVGEIELNEIPENYFQDVEQAAFSPSNIVDGIGFSPDKMLQGRIFAYPDAQRYRIGANYNALPVNKCPYMTNNYHRNGAMRFDGNGGDAPNYFPNSFDSSTEAETVKDESYKIQDAEIGFFDRNENEDDHFSQPRGLFENVFSEEEKQRTIDTIVDSMSGISGGKKDEIINRQICHWFRVSPKLGLEVAKGLHVAIEQYLK